MYMKRLWQLITNFKGIIMIKLSELLEKLYNNSYLNDSEFELYLKWVDLLKEKEELSEKSKRTTA